MQKDYEYYNEIAKGYDELHKNEQRSKFESILKETDLKPEYKLLDIGCGTCLSKDFFICDWYGVEPAEKMIEQHSNHKQLIALKKLFVAQGEKIDSLFEENFFDVIICVSTAHHFKNPDNVFLQIKKIAKLNASIIFSLLKKTSNFEMLKQEIITNFELAKTVDEGKDMLFFSKNTKLTS